MKIRRLLAERDMFTKAIKDIFLRVKIKSNTKKNYTIQSGPKRFNTRL